MNFPTFLFFMSICIVIVVVVYVYVMLSFRKKKEEMVTILVRLPKEKTTYIQMPKRTLQKLGLIPSETTLISPVGVEEPTEFVKTVPKITSIEEKPTEAISTTKVETYKADVIKCPKCKQIVMKEELIEVINHAKGGITEHITPCCHKVVKKT